MRTLSVGTLSARTRLLAPAALMGTLAAALAPAPAVADAGTSTERLTRLASLPAPTLASAPASYTVQAGDTVSGIADRFGLRTVDVLAWNGLDRTTVIYPGQVLRLTPPATPVASAPAPAAASTPASAHTVRAGDTLSSIASAYGVGLQALFDANGMGWSTVIYPGQAIAIPGAATSAAPVAAPASAPAAAPVPAPAPASVGHTVSSGDTLSGIASAYGVSLHALFEANGLGWSSIIYPGQSLAIPGVAPLSATPAAAVNPATSPSSAALDAEQAANARIIIQVGRELGVSDRGIAIALATAMVESWIRNLDWGDRDSLGLFQQRPSTGWGTADEVRDPVRAARAFFGGPSDPNGTATRGLLDIPGWESMGFAEAAQAVQISAFPDRYGQWESAAYQWLAALG